MPARALLGGRPAALVLADVLARFPRASELLAGGADCASPVIPAAARAARSCAAEALGDVVTRCSAHFARRRSRIVGICNGE